MESSVARPAPRPSPGAPPSGPPVSVPPARKLLTERIAAFCGVAALLTLLALDGGGYDIVVRQEVALAIWLLVALGFAFKVLPRARLDRAVLVPALAAVGMAAWLALGLVWTESAERTGIEITRFLGYAGLMTLVLTSLNRQTFCAAASGASAAAIAVAAVALSSRLFPDLFPTATDVARRFRSDRLNYPLDYWNGVGAWCAMAIAVGLAWSAHARSVLTRAVALAAVPVAGAAVYVTYSRGGVVGSGVAIVATLVLSRNRSTALTNALMASAGTAGVVLTIRQHPEIAEATGGAGGVQVAVVLALAGLACAGTALASWRLGADRLRLSRPTARRAVAGLAALLLIGTVLLGQGLISRAWDQFRNDEVASGPDPAARLTSVGGNRANVWASAWASFEAHPVVGTGAGTFEFWWSRDARNPEFVRDAHSLYLEALAEVGLPGLLLLVVFLAGLLLLAIRARARLSDPGDFGAAVAMTATFAVFLVNAGVDWMWEETAVGALGLGAVAITAAGGSDRLPMARRREPVGWRGARAAIVAVALLAAIAQVPGVTSMQRIRESQSAARKGDLDASRALAEDAVAAEPWAATPQFQLALVLEAQHRLADAQVEIEDAISKEQTNWRYPLLLARIEAKRGDLADARRTFLEGRKLRPLSPAYAPSSPYAKVVFPRTQVR